MKRTTVAGIVIAVMLFVCSVADAEPAAITLYSPNDPLFSVENEAQTYVAYGRERIVLPDSIVREINAWEKAYREHMEEWANEDGEEWASYWGGVEEGYNYALNSLMTRFGYYGYYTCELEGLDGEEWNNDNTMLAHELEHDMALEDVIEWEDATWGLVW